MERSVDIKIYRLFLKMEKKYTTHTDENENLTHEETLGFSSCLTSFGRQARIERKFPLSKDNRLRAVGNLPIFCFQQNIFQSFTCRLTSKLNFRQRLPTNPLFLSGISFSPFPHLSAVGNSRPTCDLLNLTSPCEIKLSASLRRIRGLN